MSDVPSPLAQYALGSPHVYTGRWSDVFKLADKVTPVRTSLGTPRFIPGAAEFPAVHELMPYRIKGIEDRAEFERAYRRRLDEKGAKLIFEKLTTIQRPDRPLMLCCYEDVRKPGDWCHRTMFVKWWQEQTGATILDLQFVDVGDTTLLPRPAEDPQGSLFG